MSGFVPSIDNELAGQVALVTGGVGGIGAAICRRLVAAGAHVLAADISPQVEMLAADLAAGWAADGDTQATARAGCLEGVQLDVTDPEAVQAIADRCWERFGRFDILVNNAGLGGRTAPVWETEIETWNKHIAVMLTGPFLMSRAFIPLMLRNNYGRIVNISSMAGKEGNADTSPYSAAKAGVLGLTKTVGKELAKTGVLCNAITPGVVESPMNHVVPREFHERVLALIPMGRPGKPRELAELVSYLAGPRLGFSTGAVFDFSGGRATY